MRNSRLLSVAPTGSISNIIGVSGGVEPYFMLGYQRTVKSMFEQERNIWVYEKTPLKLMKHLGVEDHTKLPDWATITSQNISFTDRAEVQSLIQKYVDTAISSTFNLPNEATTKDIEDIYRIAWEKASKVLLYSEIIVRRLEYLQVEENTSIRILRLNQALKFMKHG